MKTNINEEFQKLVSDPKFIEWVLRPTLELEKHWELILNENPKMKKEVEYARYIIKRLDIKTSEIDKEITSEIWDNVKSEVQVKQRSIRQYRRWIAAASIIVILGLGSALFYMSGHQRNLIDFSKIEKVEPQGNEVKLILSDNTEKLIQSEEPTIAYNKQGNVSIDSTKVNLKDYNEEQKEDEKAVEFNQLVVPKGKRSNLTLSDGTRIIVNSGSRVIYPVVFNKKRREIFIEGEAYLDVQHNKDWPFYVATDHMKVRVLGTKFNVQSYPDEAKTNVVLVKGSVQAIAKTGKVLMKESELFTLYNETGETKVEKANVIEYISWKDGWMYCNNESIANIAKKLSRYYDVDILLNDQKVERLTMTGKLDLKSKCIEVLNVISFSAPIKYKEVNQQFIISTK